MDLIQPSLINLKQFSGYKPTHSDIPTTNISGHYITIINEPESSPSHQYTRDIVNLLQDVLKFRINNGTSDEQHVYKFPNILEDDIDMVVSHPSLNSLNDNFQLLLPTFRYRLALLCKTSDLQVDKDIFIRNVTGHVWFYLGAALMLVAFFFRLSTYIHHYLKPRHSDWSWLEVIQWALGAICQQGSAKHPQGCSCRTMFLIGYCTTYLIFTGFAAGITSLLAIKTNTQQLDWHKANRLRLPFIALCNSDGENFLRNSLKEDKSRNVLNCLENIEDIISEVRDSATAAVMSETHLVHYITHYMNEDLQCKMSLSKQNKYNYYSGFVVKKGSVLKQPFNYWLLRFMEHGILKRLLSESSKPMPLCQPPPGYTEVGFEHVQTAFLIFILSMLASTIIFCLELVMVKNRYLLSRMGKSKLRIIQMNFRHHIKVSKN